MSLNFNELMNDKIDIESQFQSKFKQYRISKFYQTFVKKYNIGCLNDIVLLHPDKLKAIQDDIFSFGKNKFKQKQFEMFIRDVTWKKEYKIDMNNKIVPPSNMCNKEKKEDENENENENKKQEFDNTSQFNDTSYNSNTGTNYNKKNNNGSSNQRSRASCFAPLESLGIKYPAPYVPSSVGVSAVDKK